MISAETPATEWSVDRDADAAGAEQSHVPGAAGAPAAAGDADVEEELVLGADGALEGDAAGRATHAERPVAVATDVPAGTTGATGTTGADTPAQDAAATRTSAAAAVHASTVALLARAATRATTAAGAGRLRAGAAGRAVAARTAATRTAVASSTPHRMALPLVLAVATSGGLVGLASAPSEAPTAVRAAAATAQVSPLPALPFAKPLVALDGPTPTAAAAAPKRVAPAKASRAKRPAVVKPRYVRPVSAGISSYFGRRWGRMHEGLDFNGSTGAPIRAVTDGRVISAGYDGGYGNKVEIRHGDGVVTAYAHMSRILVRGGRVKAGEVIGLVGSTGHSTGSHLHFEVRVNGAPINPLKWLRQKGVRV